ncbi:MAG: hypothetical protein M0Q53_06780 [Prolixibacteraceae bacterium]|jgi:hypothetical protein|nr:hypothetical protein [Prolixibacteraceae bacterium]
MRTTELIKEIEKLPVQKRIFVIERTLQSIRRNEENSQMKKATEQLYQDYTTDSEFTAFSDIDYAEFYETR